MIRITQAKLPLGHDNAALLGKIRKILHLQKQEAFSFQIVKQSIDARRKPEIFMLYTVDVFFEKKDCKKEKQIVAKAGNPNVFIVQDIPYAFPKPGSLKMRHAPVIVGTGPAGLFCGYLLAKHGYRPILLERGECVEARTGTVEAFWRDGKLNPESNVQFGEGGAGAFSDGKLNTLVKDAAGRNREVLRILVEAGAPGQILYESKPHVGTDVLCRIVKNMRDAIIDYGGQVRFSSKVTDLAIENGRVLGVVINGGERLSSETVVLAIGHSARDTFSMLFSRQVPMEAKAFAVGLRVEHPQSVINVSQYGEASPKHLPPASYKLTAKAGNGRGVYSFCMCPGGYVVNASSEPGRLAVNGMSYSSRDGKNANSAIIVTVTPKDYGAGESLDAWPLAGIAFQRKLEERAYALADGSVPVQAYGDFKAAVMGNAQAAVSCGFDGIAPNCKGRYAYADVASILPKALNEAIVDGMEQFGKKIAGFNDNAALLSGVESRTSSPVRICRDDTFQSAVRGLYPCGEGAGYAGGITSAAMDGMKIAEEIAKAYAI